MKTITRLFLAFTLAAAAFASEPWTKADKDRQIVVTSLLLADWAQTRYIAKHTQGLEYTTPGPVMLANGQMGYDAGQARARSGFTEINPILGRAPKDHEVNAYFLANIAFNLLLTDLLPSRYRAAAQYIYIGIEGVYVARNFKLGIGMRF